MNHGTCRVPSQLNLDSECLRVVRAYYTVCVCVCVCCPVIDGVRVYASVCVCVCCVRTCLVLDVRVYVYSPTSLTYDARRV